MYPSVDNPVKCMISEAVHGEETALVAPWALLNARCQAPMPEFTNWAQALL